MLWPILLLVFVSWLFFRRWNRRKLINLADKLKSNKTAYPIIGHALTFIGNDEDHLMSQIQNFSREAIESSSGMISFVIGEIVYLMISDPIVAQDVLKHCIEKGDIMKPARFVTGNGSIFAPGTIWRPRRKVMASTFSPKNLNQFVDIFAEQSAVMVERIRSAAGKGPFSIWNYLTTYTMDTVCETALGVQVKAQDNPDHPFLKNFALGSRLLALRFFRPWLYNDFLYKFTRSHTKLSKAKDVVIDFIKQIITLKKKSIEEEKLSKAKSKDQTKAFLELLIESSAGSKSFSDYELQEELLVIVMAGTDTSAVGAAFTTLMVARHPDVQDKVYDELKEVFGDSNRPLERSDLPRLKYLDAVIREAMRLYPPVPVIGRDVDKDLTLASGITLTKGAKLMVSIWGVHHNPRYWGPDVEEFRPERFLNDELKHPAQYIPFSHGPRNCLGYQYAMMSSKTMLSTLFRHYRVLPATADTASNGNSCQHPPLRVKFDIMMKDVDNFIVQLVPRV